MKLKITLILSLVFIAVILKIVTFSKNFVEMTKQVARLAAHPKTAANGGQNLWRTAAKAWQNALKKGRFLPIMDTAEHCANNHNIACSTKSKGENEHDLFA